MKLLLLSSLITLMLISPEIKSQEQSVYNTNARTLRVDPNLANGGAMSQVFAEINFIPLETTKESLFGDITQLEVTDNHYIIFDRDTKSIVIFNRKGQFMARIRSMKINGDVKSGADNNGFYGFTLVKKGAEDIIQIKIKEKIYSYDLTGKPIDMAQIESKTKYDEKYDFGDSIQVVSYFKDNKTKDNATYSYAILKNNQPIAKYFPLEDEKYSKMGYFAVGGPSFIRTSDPKKMNAVRYYDYNIYQITNKGISVRYTFVFPDNNTIPNDFNTNPVYLGKKMDYFFKNTNKIFGIGHTYQIGDFLYFKCGSLSPYIRKSGSFVYDLKNNYLISLNKLDPDSLSHFLPIIGRWENDFKKYDGKCLYASLSSLEMFAYFEQEKAKKIKYPEQIETYFAKGTKKDNPVIIQLKPKQSR